MSKSPSLRRIQADIRELAIDPSDRYHAAPLESDMFEWHFTIRGADGTDFEGGVYHGRILLPAEYPFKPPNIIFLTPSGRFETGTKVCLSFSAYHPELWQPAWGIRLILEALISFLPTKGDGAIGALDWTSEERKRLAKKSVDFKCQQCGNCASILKSLEGRVKKKKRTGGNGNVQMSRFQEEIQKLHALQAAAEGGKKKEEGEKEGGSTDEKKDVEIEDNQLKQESKILDDTKVIESTENPSPSKQNVESESEIADDSKSAPVKPPANSVILNSCLDECLVIDEVEKSESEELKDFFTEKKSSIPEVNPTENLGTNHISGNQIDEPNDTGMSSTVNEEQEDVQAECNEVDTPVVDDINNNLLDSPWLTDSMVNVGIAIFAVIIYILSNQITYVIEELKDLEAQRKAT